MHFRDRHINNANHKLQITSDNACEHKNEPRIIDPANMGTLLLIDIQSIVKHRDDTLICLCAMQSHVPHPHNSIMDVAQGAVVLTYILVLSSSKKQIQN